MVIAKDLFPVEVRENTLKKVLEVLERFAKQGMVPLDPEEDMKVTLIEHFLVSSLSLSLMASILLRFKENHTKKLFGG